MWQERPERYFLALIAAAFIAPSNAQTIRTVAGGGANDGRPATRTALSVPAGIAVDADGNLYIAEPINNRVLKVDALTNIIATVAGNGQSGFSGDGGPAIAAEMIAPRALAVDASRNLYIVDSGNDRVRRVDRATQIITTYVGRGSPFFDGDGGPAIAAGISPRDIAFDGSGNMYIADTPNNRIRRVDAVTRTISTIAGGGTPGFSGDNGPAGDAAINFPLGVAADATGSVYIADWQNHRIRKIDSGTKLMTTVAGNGSGASSGDNGPATAAGTDPYAVAVDGAGNLFITETADNRIRYVDAATKTITTVVGTGTYGFSGDGGPSAAAQIASPLYVTTDGSRNVYVDDGGNQRIRKIDRATSTIATVAGGTGDDEPATAADLLSPRDVIVDRTGNLFIADQFNHRIRKVDALTGMITTIAGTGIGGYGGDGGPATSAKLYSPFGIAMDGSGNLYIAEADNFRVRKVDASTGVITTFAGNGTEGFSGDGGPAAAASLGQVLGIAIDPSGNVFIADPLNLRIRRVDAATQRITTVAGGGNTSDIGDNGPATSAQLSLAEGVATDSTGNLYVADTGHHRIRKIDASTGIITTIAGSGTIGFGGDGGPAVAAAMTYPSRVAVDSRGDVFVADTRNHRIRRIDALTKVISTVAGSGDNGFSGDGGAAVDAKLSYPEGIAIDAAGTIYVADNGNNRIRAVSAPTQRKRVARPH